MDGIIAIGAFGMTLVGIGMAENAGWSVNGNAVTFVMEMVKFGGILYILKMVTTTFL